MTGCHHLGKAALLSCPTNAPGIHLQNTLKPVFADHSGESGITQATPRPQRVDQMVMPMIGTFTTDGGRNRHLRHDGRPTPPDQTPVDQQHIRTMACGFERGIHASTAGTDHKNVGRQMHCFSP
jgi:hypothetical protein